MARPRTPTALKLIKGTARPCRINRAEPKPSRAIPSPPEHLSERARIAWGGIAVMLDRMGILTEADGLALEGLCETYAQLIEARKSLRSQDATVYESVSDSGSIRRSQPEVTQIADLDRRFLMWLRTFGLTPADRSRVSAIAKDDNEDPWATV